MKSSLALWCLCHRIEEIRSFQHPLPLSQLYKILGISHVMDSLGEICRLMWTR